MPNDSPAVIPYNATGSEAVPVGDASVLTPESSAIVAAGSDGSTARFVLVDVAGRQVLVGAAAAGSPPAGNPVLVGGSDGSAVRPLALDSDGRAVIVGPGGPVGVSGSVQIVGPVGITGPVGLTGPLQRVIEPVGITGPIQRISDPVGITGPVGVTGAVQVSQPTASALNAVVQGPGDAGDPTGGILTVQGASGAQPQPVAGADGPGAAPSANPVLVAGWDGSLARIVRTDQVGNPQIVGAIPAGVAPTGAPVRVAGQDGNAVRELRTDDLGRPVAVGPGPAGAAPTGAPILVAGFDGTLVRTHRLDVSGHQIVVGPAPAAAGPTGSPLRMAGTDGSLLRDVRTDDAGRVNAVGPAAVGTGPIGHPVYVALQSATGTVQVPEVWTGHPTGAAAAVAVRDVERTNPTFYAVFDRVTMAADKYLATLFNTSSTRKVVVQRIWVYNWQFDGVQGGDTQLELIRITARTAGTSVTIRAEDTADSVSSGISADTDSTAVTEAHLIQRVFSSGDEVSFTRFAIKSFISIPLYALRYERRRGQRGITLRQDQGVTVKFVGGDADGTTSVVFEFTDEVA